MAGLSGNVSVRLGDGRFLVTPHGLAKSDLRRRSWWRWMAGGAVFVVFRIPPAS